MALSQTLYSTQTPSSPGRSAPTSSHAPHLGETSIALSLAPGPLQDLPIELGAAEGATADPLSLSPFQPYRLPILGEERDPPFS